jgi:hypothetical protein
LDEILLFILKIDRWPQKQEQLMTTRIFEQWVMMPEILLSVFELGIMTISQQRGKQITMQKRFERSQ